MIQVFIVIGFGVLIASIIIWVSLYEPNSNKSNVDLLLHSYHIKHKFKIVKVLETKNQNTHSEYYELLTTIKNLPVDIWSIPKILWINPDDSQDLGWVTLSNKIPTFQRAKVIQYFLENPFYTEYKGEVIISILNTRHDGINYLWDSKQYGIVLNVNLNIIKNIIDNLNPNISINKIDIT